MGMFPNFCELFDRPIDAPIVPENTMDFNATTRESAKTASLLPVWPIVDSMVTYMPPVYYTPPSGSDQEIVTSRGSPNCIVDTAYLVQDYNGDLCVATVPTGTCKTTCNVGDVFISSIKSNCWNPATAPKRVIEGYKVGYVTEAFTSGETVRDVSFTISSLCLEKHVMH